MLGETIGNFKIVAKVGRGGMGEVWLAEQEALGTRVAVKTLLEAYPPESEDVQRFFNEARAVSRIQHAGITKIFDSGILPNGRAYLVMEFLDGESLAARILRGRLSKAALADIGRQIASVLDATHSAGITHRDLKPENVFLVPDREQPRGERVKVLDFGVAKLTGTIAPNSPKTFGTLGTPMYMAPEQWGDASQVDWRADLYSLGCLTFEMACGRPPFPVKTVAEACAKHLHDVPPRASSIASGVPPLLDTLIAQLLEKEPEDRPRSMRDVARTFETIGKMAGIDETTETLPVGTFPPNADVLATVTAGQARGAVTMPVRKRGLAVAASVGVVAVGAIGYVLATRGTPPPPPMTTTPVAPSVTPIEAPNVHAMNEAAKGSGSDQTLQAIQRAAGDELPVAPPPHVETKTAVKRTAPSIDRSAFSHVIADRHGVLAACNTSDHRVIVNVTLAIGSDGRATKITGDSDATELCVANILRTLAFPRPTAPLEITIPLALESKTVAALPEAELPDAPDKEGIKRGLLAAEKSLDACMTTNGVTTRQMLAITIGPSGRVTAADVTGALSGSEYAACVFTALRASSFPASKSGLKVTVPVTPPS